MDQREDFTVYWIQVYELSLTEIVARIHTTTDGYYKNDLCYSNKSNASTFFEQ